MWRLSTSKHSFIRNHVFSSFVATVCDSLLIHGSLRSNAYSVVNENSWFLLIGEATSIPLVLKMLYVCPTRGPLDWKGVYSVVSMCLQLMIQYSTCLIWAEKLFVNPRDGAPSFQPQFQEKKASQRKIWPEVDRSTNQVQPDFWNQLVEEMERKKKKSLNTFEDELKKNQKCIYYRLHRQNPQKTTTWRWAQLKIDAKISKSTLEWTHQ